MSSSTRAVFAGERPKDVAGRTSRAEQQTMEVYHERQVGMLCGVHCLNTLLQARFYDEVALGEIGAELDR